MHFPLPSVINTPCAPTLPTSQIRDVLDMRKNKWVPRREAFTAKKLDEVHAEAEAELGMVVSSRLVADLPALPTAARRGGEELGLLPPLRGGGDGWEVVGRRGISKPTFGAGGSALVGEYRPPEPLRRPSAPEAEVAAAAAEPVATAAANAPRAAGGKPLSADDVASKARSFMREYLSVGDAAEAGLCLQELRAAPKEGDVADLSGVVCAAVEELFDTQVRRGVVATTYAPYAHTGGESVCVCVCLGGGVLLLQLVVVVLWELLLLYDTAAKAATAAAAAALE